jgi:hypothetical protein
VIDRETEEEVAEDLPTEVDIEVGTEFPVSERFGNNEFGGPSTLDRQAEPLEVARRATSTSGIPSRRNASRNLLVFVR